MLNGTGDVFIYNVKAPKLKNQPQKLVQIATPNNKPNATMALSGTITDYYSKKPLQADVIVYDAITSTEKGRYKSADDGKYYIILPYGNNYKVDFTSNNYSHTYYFKDLSAWGKSSSDQFDTELYNEVNLDLNIYDNELFYPLTPSVSIYNAENGNLITKDLKPVADGKYNARLKIGQNYRINIESDMFDPYDEFFDLRTMVFYSDFEKSIEMKSTKRIVVLNIVGSDGKEVSDINFVAKNINRNELITEVKKDDQGRYTVAFRIGDTYEIDVTKEGHTFFNTTYTATEEASDVQGASDKSEPAPVVDIAIQQLAKNVQMTFNDITFEFNSAELNAASYEELGRIERLLKENPSIRIEISAHTDDIGSDAMNMALSEKRAKTVIDYLVSRGVPRAALKSKGYGKSRPVVPNNSDENRAKNRRVEMKIIE
jgi:outer membrane protein OmpA-like peptidoglycan-associated protein